DALPIYRHLVDVPFQGLRGNTPQSLHTILSETEDSTVLSATRQLGHPVFLVCQLSYDRVNSTTTFHVGDECPKLVDMKFATKLSPEQLYQDLSCFMGNTMRGSPDIDTPVKLADKDRIVQHGFDLKQSFRHRKGEAA